VTLRGILEVILKVYEESGGVDGWDSVIFGLVFDGLMLWNIFDYEMNPFPSVLYIVYYLDANMVMVFGRWLLVSQ